jgi:hypothetical protein
MEARDHGERSRRLDGDVGAAMGTEAVRGRVDARDGVGSRASVARSNGEAIDAIAVAEQLLQMVEMQPHAMLAARDLGWIGAALGDGGDDDGVARQARLGGDDDAVADVKTGVGGQSRVDRDGAWRVLRPLRIHAQGKEEQERSESGSHGVAG